MGCLSMTGFGSATHDHDGFRYEVQVRTVNHRYLDIRMHLPDEAQMLAPAIEGVVRKRLLRGRCELHLRVIARQTSQVVDVAFAQAAYRSLCELRDQLAPEQTVPISAIAAIPAAFAASNEVKAELIESAAVACVESALAGLMQERQREGEAIASDLRAQCAEARRIQASLSEMAGDAVAKSRQRLRERVARLFDGHEVDAQRLEQEVVLLADKSDIHEELERTVAHLDKLEKMLSGKGAEGGLGRKLDFMLQELAREANTMASKSVSAELTHAVVELKSCIERMRQQCQNVQ